MIFTKIAFRNFSRKKVRNALTILGIIIGVALYVGVNIASESSFQEYENYITSLTGDTDILITSTTGEFFEDKEENLATRGLHGIEASGRIQGYGVISKGGDHASVLVYGIQPETDFEFNGYTIEGSSILEGESLILSKSLEEELNLRLNEFVDLETPYGNHYRARVVGVFHTQLEAQGYMAYINMGVAQAIYEQPGRINQIIIKVDDITRTKSIKEAIENNLGENYKVRAIKEESVELWESNLRSWRSGLDMMAIIALLVCMGLVLNVVYMNIEERTYEIGVLRALGAKKKQVFWMFTCEILLLAIIGVTLGLVTGLGMARLLNIFASKIFWWTDVEIKTFVLKPGFFIAGAAAGFLSTILSGMIPSGLAANTDVIKALKPKMRPPGKRGAGAILMGVGVVVFGISRLLSALPFDIYMVDAILTIVSLVLLTAGGLRIAATLFGFLGPLTGPMTRIIARNLGRNLKRAAITYGTIAIVVNFIVVIGGIEMSMTKSISDTTQQYLGADILIFPSIPEPVTFTDELKRIATSKIYEVTCVKFSETRSEDVDIGLIAIEPNNFNKIFKLEFASPTPENPYSRLQANPYTVILVEPLADTLGVSVGDQIPVECEEGTLRLTVVGVAKGSGLSWFSLGGGFTMSEAAIISFRTMRAFFVTEENPYLANIFFIKLKDPKYIDLVGSEVEKEFRNRDFHLYTFNDLLNDVQDSVHRFFEIFDTILFMAVLSATFGITTTMIMNVRERTREMGILRSQGVKPRQLLIITMGEAMLLGLLGLLVGLISGLISLKSIIDFMSQFGTSIAYMTPWAAIRTSILTAVFTSIIGVLYPCHRALKVDIVEALRYRG